MVALVLSLSPENGVLLPFEIKKGEWAYWPIKAIQRGENILCNSLQLSDLLVEMSNVLLDDVRQLLDLDRLVVKYGFPLGQQCQLLQFCVG